jgi:hypothetical protein
MQWGFWLGGWGLWIGGWGLWIGGFNLWIIRLIRLWYRYRKFWLTNQKRLYRTRGSERNAKHQIKRRGKEKYSLKIRVPRWQIIIWKNYKFIIFWRLLETRFKIILDTKLIRCILRKIRFSFICHLKW